MEHEGTLVGYAQIPDPMAGEIVEHVAGTLADGDDLIRENDNAHRHGEKRYFEAVVEDRKPDYEGGVLVLLFYAGLLVDIHYVRQQFAGYAEFFFESGQIFLAYIAGVDPAVFFDLFALA